MVLNHIDVGVDARRAEFRSSVNGDLALQIGSAVTSARTHKLIHAFRSTVHRVCVAIVSGFVWGDERGSMLSKGRLHGIRRVGR